SFSHFALARYNADGSLDATFGGDGRDVTPVGLADSVQGIVGPPDGDNNPGGRVYDGVSAVDFALARYNADGSLDASFGVGGKVVTHVDPLYNERAYSVAVQTDGRIVVVGTVDLSGGSSGQIAVARYDPNGALDASFGGD